MVNYLPGTNVTLNDLGLKIAPPPAGPKVTLLGVTSNTGINVNEPFTVSSVEKALNALYFDMSGVAGWPNTTFPGELSLGIEEAVNAGAPNIEVVVIGQYRGQALLDYLALSGNYPTGRYTDLSGSYNLLRNRDLDVVVPLGVHMDDIVNPTDTLHFGKQLANFCFQATKEQNSAIGVIPVKPPLQWALKHAATIVTGTNTTLSGELVSLFGLSASGTYPTTPAAFRSGLANMHFGTPSVTLLNEWVNWHARTGVGCISTVGNASEYSTFHSNWLKGAADQNNNILDNITEAAATSVSSNYFTSWQAVDSDGVPATDTRAIKVDAGAFINVLAAPIRSVNTQIRSAALGYGAPLSNTSINTAGAAAYAGLITSLAPQSSTTNKQIGGITSAKLISARQANDLTGMRYVTIYSRAKGLTVSSGTTGAYNVTKYVRSDYVRLTTVRIVHAAVDLIRSVADKYIGEPNNAPQMNALDAEIDQVLLSLKGQGALNGYQFTISSTPNQRVLGELDINLTLVPAFEITRINLVVSLSKEL